MVNDTVSWGLLLGVLTPIATSIVQQPRWSSSVRAVIGAIVSVIVGVVTVLASGDISDTSTLLQTVAVTLVAAWSSYRGFWKPTGVAPVLETKTSPGSSTPPVVTQP
jgi:hypothetical protein